MGRSRNGRRFMVDVVVLGRQVLAREHQGGAPPIPSGHPCIGTIIHVGDLGRHSFDRVLGWVVDRHVPHG